jgi:hypothetical protein
MIGTITFHKREWFMVKNAKMLYSYLHRIRGGELWKRSQRKV